MYINKDFNHSYWEKKHLFKHYDVVVVGAGIVGLSTAISIKEKDQKRSVLIIEQGSTANGASTKNAGFACFGSVGELCDDLKTMPEDLVWETVQMRYKGLKKLRKRLGDKHMNYLPYGGYEVFKDVLEFEKCSEQITYLNKRLKQNIGLKNCFVPVKKNNFGFQHIKGILKNQFEGQIDTGLMMQNLAHLAHQMGVQMLFNCGLKNFEQLKTGVQLHTNLANLAAHKLVIATNGFAKQLLPQLDVEPARAQVLITKKIEGLKLKGSFHFDKGYYYFRNIDGRVLLGGGRNMDFKKENTLAFDLNQNIQKALDQLLKTMILPNTKHEVDYRWTGIMGVGKEKKPIVKLHSKDVVLAVRMGGMGVAIGSMVGEAAAKLID